MNEIAVRGGTSSVRRWALSFPNLSVLLNAIHPRYSAEEKRDRLLRNVERDQALAELHHNANVALQGVNVDPLYACNIRW